MWRKLRKKLRGFYKKKLCVLNAVQDSTKKKARVINVTQKLF